jgi:hypothetical protein
MLLERERDLVPAFDVRGQERESGEAKVAERAVEVRSAHGHDYSYAPAPSFPVSAPGILFAARQAARWQPGHQ